MAVKKITYKEPAGYFTPAMKKAADDFDKKQAAEAKKESGKATQKPKKNG